MKRIIGFYFCLICFSVNAQSLSQTEIDYLHQDINAMFAQFENGDASGLLEKTHDSIYSLVGGKDSYKQVMEDSVKQIMDMGIKFISADLKDPTKLYSAGDEEVCFVPRISVMEANGIKIQSTGFMIAIREKGAEQWTYLDGSGLRNNQALLWQLLPALERDIDLPPNYNTQL